MGDRREGVWIGHCRTIPSSHHYIGVLGMRKQRKY